MAYLPHFEFESPTVFCDSTIFSELYTSCSLSSEMSLEPTSPVTSRKEKAVSSKVIQQTGPGEIFPIVFPILPQAHNYSALGNYDKFKVYIDSQLPLATDTPMVQPTQEAHPRRSAKNAPCQENSIFLNNLLKSTQKVTVGTLSWMADTMFPDSKLLVPFDRVAIGKCTALWDDDAVSLPD